MPRLEQILSLCLEDENGCWLWTGFVTKPGQGSNSHGYGVVRNEFGRKEGVHRVVYRLSTGEDISNKDIDHLCRVRHCVNPSHLEAVTHAENVLRGEGLAAINARKLICKCGEPFDKEYTNKKTGRKRRVCSACAKRRSREFEARRRSP